MEQPVIEEKEPYPESREGSAERSELWTVEIKSKAPENTEFQGHGKFIQGFSVFIFQPGFRIPRRTADCHPVQ